MAEGGSAAGGVAGGAGSEFRLSATLEMRDQLSGKLRSTVSQLKSVDSAVSKLGNNGEVAKLSKRLDALNDLRQQVNQFKELKKSVVSTQQAYNQTNSATAELARRYKQGQSAISQLKAKQAELQKTFEQSQSATSQLKSKLGELKAEATKAKDSGAVEEYKKLQNQIKSTSAELKSSQAMTRQTSAELKSLTGSVKQAQRELDNIGSSFEQSKKKAAKLKQELQNQQPALHNMRQGLLSQGFNTRDAVASDRKLRDQIAATSRDLRTQQLRETLSTAGMKLSTERDVYAAQRQRQLRDTLSAAGMNLSGGNVNVNVNGNATSKLGSIRKELQSLTQKTWNVAVNAKNAVGKRISGIAEGAAMGMGAQVMGVAGLGYGMMDAVNTYKDFEYQMATVKAITQANDEQMAVLTRRAKELGETTMFKASEVGKAEEFMGMAGWKTEQIDKGLPAVLNLAAASGEELARVSDIVTDSMTAFGLKATDIVKTADGKIVNASDHFSDIMAKLATSANTTVGLAGETAKYSAAVVGSLYASQSTDDKMRAVEDWAAITGIMANAGIKGSMSGTAQRSMLTRLAGMQQNANAARESLGVDFVYREDEYNDKGKLVHQAGQTRRIRDVMEDMRARFQGDFDPEHLLDMTERLEGKEFTKQQRIKLSKMIEDVKAKGGKMTDADKATLTSMLAGQEGMAAWLSVLMASEEDWKNMADAMDTAAGTADKMSKIKMDTLAGDIKTLGSAFEALQLEIFEGSGGDGLRSFTQAITEDIRAFKKSLEDGFDIGDIGGMIAKVATQLKDKFLAFDGVGSILAGGALVMGLKKIFNLTMQIKNAAMTMKDWYRGAATTAPPTVGGGKGGAISQSVGSMVVHANSVVVNGKAVSQGAGSVAGQSGRNGTVAGGGAPSRGGTSPPVPSTMSKLGGVAKVAGGAAVLTLLFGGMDILSTRSTNENRVDEAQSNITRLKEQQAQQQTEYQAAQNAYDTNVGDPEITADQIAMLRENAEKQRAILENTGKDLAAAESTLNDIKKETAKNNNEALFATGGAAVGAATGAAIGSFIPVIGNIAGLVIGAALGYAGSEIGRDFSKNFDFDVLGWITGKNDKTSAGEKPIPKADWKLEDGRMYSQLSSSEKFAYHQKESETDKSSRLAAESVVAEAEHQRFEIETAKKQAAASQRHRQKDASQEEIDSGVAKIAKEEERKRTNWNQPFAGTNTQAPVVASMYGDQTSREMANVTNKEVSDSIGAKIKNEVDFVKSLFSSKDFSNEPNHLGIQKPESTGQRDHLGMDVKKPDQIGTDFWSSVGDFFKSAAEKTKVESKEQSNLGVKSEKPENIQDANKFGTDFWSSVGDFFKSAAEKSSTETNQPNHLGIQQAESTGQRNHLGLEVSEIKMPDFNFSQWWSEKTADIPDFSQMWRDFNISDMLPDFSLSEWISSKTADLPDFSQMWADVSVSDMLPELNISEWLSQSMLEFDLTSILPDFSTIETSISETFAQIPTAASEAFNTIATSASEGLSSIQTAWNELPEFFDGLFAGLGGVASSAGAAIASGINSAIGTIQSAWESFSGWLSAKISSLSSMASNAAASIGINIGHNATGTASWRGGFTEVNEQGGEIIDLPSGARIYPHATTMKMLQSDLKAGRLDDLIQSSGFGLSTPAAFEYDALGNVKGYSGMADNLIREDDLSPIREAKLQAQREFMSLSAFPKEFQAPELSAFPQAFSVGELTQGVASSSTSNSTTNTNNNGVTVTGNTFNIRKESDIDEIAFKIFEMFADIQANHAGI